MVCRGRCVVDRCSIGRGSVGLCLTRVTTGGGRGVDSLSRVGDVSNETVGVVGGVGDGLDPAVGEVDRVGAINVSTGITVLCGVEVGLGVVIGNTIGEGVWLRGLLGIFHRGVVGRCRGMVDRSRSMVGRGSVVDRSRGMVDNWGRGMVGNRGRGMVGSRSSMDNSMVAMADAMAVSNAVSNVGHMRHRGSAGQTKKGRDHEGLKKVKA